MDMIIGYFEMMPQGCPGLLAWWLFSLTFEQKSPISMISWLN
jgi:hypothetical protein